MSLRAEVHTAFSAALSAPWRAIAEGFGAFDNEPWLRGLEGRTDPRYVLVRDGDQPLGAAACYLFRSPADLIPIPAYYDVTFYHLQTLAGSGAPSIPVERTLPLVIVGPPISGTHHRLLIRQGISPDLRQAVLRALVERIEALGEEIGAQLVVFAHLHLDPVRELLALRPEGIPGFVAAMMYLDLPGSFEGWIDGLGKKMRKTVRRELKSLAEEGLRIERRRLEDCLSFVEPLYLEGLRRHPEGYGDHLEEVVSTTILACVSAAAQSRVFVTLQGEKPIGVAVRFRNGELYQGKINAHSAVASKKSALYFNQNYATIDAAIREGVKTIDFGGAANEAKLLRGCHAVPAFSVFLCRRECSLRDQRRFLLEQNRRLVGEASRDVSRFGQHQDQAERDLGAAERFVRELD